MQFEHDDNCLFCRIVAGELEARVAGESETALAFFDINPAAPSHVLVVPRRHVVDAEALGEHDGDLLGELFFLARRVARDCGVEKSGYRIVINVGEDSGAEVPHLHLHLLAGRQFGWPPG